MELNIETGSVSVEPNGRTGVMVTVEVEAGDIAEQLPDADRLEGMDVDVVRAWLIKNDDQDDILVCIGLDKIHEFLSRAEQPAMTTFLLCWLATSIILVGGLARLAHLAKLRDQRAADGVNWSFTA